MNIRATIRSHVKNNKAFYMILGLNLIISSSLILITGTFEHLEFHQENEKEQDNQNTPIDSLDIKYPMESPSSAFPDVIMDKRSIWGRQLKNSEISNKG